jgi:hypothetical protein
MAAQQNLEPFVWPENIKIYGTKKHDINKNYCLSILLKNLFKRVLEMTQKANCIKYQEKDKREIHNLL